MEASPVIRPVVPGSLNDEGFTTLRRAAPPRAERYGAGRALRDLSPRSEMAHWRAPADRPPVLHQVVESHEGRQEP